MKTSCMSHQSVVETPSKSLFSILGIVVFHSFFITPSVLTPPEQSDTAECNKALVTSQVKKCTQRLMFHSHRKKPPYSLSIY